MDQLPAICILLFTAVALGVDADDAGICFGVSMTERHRLHRAWINRAKTAGSLSSDLYRTKYPIAGYLFSRLSD